MLQHFCGQPYLSMHERGRRGGVTPIHSVVTMGQLIELVDYYN